MYEKNQEKKVEIFLHFRSNPDKEPDPVFHEADLDPDQNETDPQHWINYYKLCLYCLYMQASANQRAGRAGRVAAGKCFR